MSFNDFITMELVKLAPDLYADAVIADQVIPRVIEALSNEEALTAGELKPYLVEGISRKWAIPWLEFLDRSKVTLRRGNHRTLHPSRKKELGVSSARNFDQKKSASPPIQIQRQRCRNPRHILERGRIGHA